jgi:glutathione S-transferase
MRLLDSDITTREVLNWQGLHLVHYQGSACSQKVRIFMNLKKVDWQSHHLDLSAHQNYEPWFLGVNPRGLVPVLVHDGAVHIESNDILAYLEQVLPEPALIPPQQQNEIFDALRVEDDLHLDLRALTMRFVIPKALAQKPSKAMHTYAETDGSVHGQPDTRKSVELTFWREYAQNGVTNKQVRESAHRFKEVYALLENQLAQHAYLTGDEISLLDIAWFIYTRRLMTAGYPFARLHPRVLAWHKGLSARPEFAKEVVPPAPLRFITAVLHAVQKLQGSTLEKVADL